MTSLRATPLPGTQPDELPHATAAMRLAATKRQLHAQLRRVLMTNGMRWIEADEEASRQIASMGLDAYSPLSIGEPVE